MMESRTNDGRLGWNSCEEQVQLEVNLRFGEENANLNQCGSYLYVETQRFNSNKRPFPAQSDA